MRDFLIPAAGPVGWNLIAVESNRPCELTVRHARDVTVESFRTAAEALWRQALEDPPVAAGRLAETAVPQRTGVVR